MLYDKLLMSGNPLIVNDPNRIWYVTANYLVAYGEDPQEWIGKPASIKPTNDPMEEHTMMRDGRYTPVEPQENHMEHIQVHTEELNGMNILLWPAERVNMLKTHIQQHMQMMQQMMAAASGMSNIGSQTNEKGGENADTNGGAAPNQKGGAAIAGGEPDVSVAPDQASGTAEQQASGAAGGRV
jgi:hypothetical protein